MLRMAAILALLLTACSGDQSQDASQARVASTSPSAGQPAADGVVGIQWQWINTITPAETIEVQEPARYTLRLNADGRAEMRFDCNRGGGSYEMSENRISFGPMMSTRMACPPDSQDSVFMAQLEKVASFFVSDGDLFLEMPYDSGTMRFARGEGQD